MKRLRLFWICFLVLVCAGFAYAGSKTEAHPKLTNDDCLTCHSDASMVDGKEIHGDAFKASIHGSMFTCVDCHTAVKSIPHDAGLAKPKCITCHADEQKAYDNGIHGKALAAGNAKAAQCESCHGNIHEILSASDPKSRTAKLNIPKTCGECHSQPIPGMADMPAISYQESVHGKLTATGDEKAAVCSDCHGNHDILPPSDPASTVYRTNIPKTCARCHGSEAGVFATSIHGKALAEGNVAAPVCTTCHGVHSIKAVNNRASLVSPRNQGGLACGQCHNNVMMTQEFGIPGGRFSSYRDSYHGMANAEGSTRTAICSSCHGAHNILPASDPKSTINPANLVRTCGQCHLGANANFAKGEVHLNPEAVAQANFGTRVVDWVRKFYVMLIISVVGFMVLHNLMIFVHKLIDRRNNGGHLTNGPRIVVRMTKNQRIQHYLLFLSFLTLVVTGFALKYPDVASRLFLVDEVVRRNIHRFAGSLMIVVALYHIVYLAFYREGRRMLLDMLPVLKDATDVVDVVAYNLGFSSKKPQFKRFNYAEKMEYWALVWGTFVMALTGLAIWFKVGTTIFLPGWWINVAITVHFYEAILATLAIIVWHFYQVILDPDTYPVNFAFFDGKMSVEHYQEEHGLDAATLSQYAGAAGDEIKAHHEGKDSH
ncbi:MAG: cytochrome b/b6 domain-containing protein [Candidatus Korobacteraceae bacterium]